MVFGGTKIIKTTTLSKFFLLPSVSHRVPRKNSDDTSSTSSEDDSIVMMTEPLAQTQYEINSNSTYNAVSCDGRAYNFDVYKEDDNEVPKKKMSYHLPYIEPSYDEHPFRMSSPSSPQRTDRSPKVTYRWFRGENVPITESQSLREDNEMKQTELKPLFTFQTCLPDSADDTNDSEDACLLHGGIMKKKLFPLALKRTPLYSPPKSSDENSSSSSTFSSSSSSSSSTRSKKEASDAVRNMEEKVHLMCESMLIDDWLERQLAFDLESLDEDDYNNNSNCCNSSSSTDDMPLWILTDDLDDFTLLSPPTISSLNNNLVDNEADEASSPLLLTFQSNSSSGSVNGESSSSSSSSYYHHHHHRKGSCFNNKKHYQPNNNNNNNKTSYGRLVRDLHYNKSRKSSSSYRRSSRRNRRIVTTRFSPQLSTITERPSEDALTTPRSPKVVQLQSQQQQSQQYHFNDFNNIVNKDKNDKDSDDTASSTDDSN